MPMRNWVGPVLFAIGAWMMFTALQRRKRAHAARSEARAKGLQVEIYSHSKFALAWAVARPLVNGALVFTAIGVTGFSLGLGEDSLLSPLDVAGFLFLLLAYGVWFSINTRYLDVVPATLPVRSD